MSDRSRLVRERHWQRPHVHHGSVVTTDGVFHSARFEPRPLELHVELDLPLADECAAMRSNSFTVVRKVTRRTSSFGMSFFSDLSLRPCALAGLLSLR